METVLLAILGGAAGAALINGVFELIRYKVKRKDDIKDRNRDRDEDVVCGVRILLYDRIKHLGKGYLSAGSLTAEELEDLIAMHSVYHNQLSGNGFLDNIMTQVKQLQIKN